jgi:hypothetical protein
VLAKLDKKTFVAGEKERGERREGERGGREREYKIQNTGHVSPLGTGPP